MHLIGYEELLSIPTIAGASDIPLEQLHEFKNHPLISMFNALGIAMNVDCERDMREMFLWYQKYQMSGKRLSCKKMFGIITSNG